MHFTHDTNEVLTFVAALANTVPGATTSGVDELATTEALVELLDSNTYTGRRDLDSAELAQVQATRTRLRELWTMPVAAAVAAVNQMLADAVALPQLVRHDGLDWHIHATSPDAPLAERIRVEAALAFVDVIRADATDRLRDCAAEDCDGLLVDLSRNGSKRFCSVRCGNRVNAVTSRERRSGIGRASTP